jgi:hypothetical protein
MMSSMDRFTSSLSQERRSCLDAFPTAQYTVIILLFNVLAFFGGLAVATMTMFVTDLMLVLRLKALPLFHGTLLVRDIIIRSRERVISCGVGSLKKT